MGGQSQEVGSCTDVEQNNPLSYSSQEFGRSGETQMWKIAFQIYKKKKHPNKPLQQRCVKVCWELSMVDQVFDDTLTNLIFSGFLLRLKKQNMDF